MADKVKDQATPQAELAAELKKIDNPEKAGELAKAYIDLSGQTEEFKKLAESMKTPALEALKESSGNISKALEANPSMQTIREMTGQLNKSLSSLLHNSYFKELKQSTERIAEILEANRARLAEQAERLQERYRELEELTPFIEAEIEAAKSTPGLANLSIDDFWDLDFDPAEEPAEPLWRDIYTRAKQRKADFEDAQLIVQDVETLTATADNLEEIMFGVDKLNSELWNFEEIESGQLQYRFNMASEADQERGRQLPLLLSLDFEAAVEQGLTLKRQINHYDERLYSVVDAFQQAGNVFVHFNQLYYAMGHTTKPNSTQLKRIADALQKMNFTLVYIDNKAEAEAYNYEHYYVDNERLLPGRVIIERDTKTDKITQGYLHIQGVLPAAEFSRRHGNQVTTIQPRLLQTGLSDTEINLSLEHYLIRRIARAKRGFERAAKKYAADCKKYNKGEIAKEPKRPEPKTSILFDTLFKETNNNTKKRRHDAKPKIDEILKHYAACGYISKYRLQADKIIITW